MKEKMIRLVISEKIKTFVLCIAGVLLIYSIVGFLIIPAVLKNQIHKIANQEFSRNALAKDIKFNPFSMELTISGFEINNLDNSHFTYLDNLYINVAVLKSITELTLTIDQLMLNQPSIVIQRDKQGNFNFSDLLNSENEKKPDDASVFPLTVSEIVISDGKVRWEDNHYSTAQQEKINPLNLTINNFTTQAEEQSQLGFSLLFASGGKFEWDGQFALEPLHSTGQIRLDKLGFQRIWQLFLQDSTKFKILSGTELIEADYHLSATEKGLQLLVENAHIDFFDIQLSEKNNTDPLISITEFKVSGINLDLLNKNIAISKISTKDARFKAWLNADGSLNYQSLFASETEEKHQLKPSPENSNKDPDPWNISVAQLEVNNFAFSFIDKSLAKPVHFNLGSMNLNATELAINTDQRSPELENGLQFLLSNAEVDFVDFQLAEKDSTEPLVNVPGFKISGISFDLLKKSIAISQIATKDARIKARLNSDGNINYQSLFATESTTNDDQQEEQIVSASKKESAPWDFNLAQLELENFDFNFIDNSLATPAHINLSSINLNASKITNKPSSAMPFNLDLTFNEKGHLKLKGDSVLEPFSSNLQLEANSIAIKEFQPYIDEFLLLDVISGLFNVKADVSILQDSSKPLAITVKGNSNISNFVSRDQISNKDFLNWKKLSLQKIDIDLTANSYKINRVNFEKPYSRILIRKDKTINVSDIVKNADKKNNVADKKPQNSNIKVIKPTFKITHFNITEGVSDFSDVSLILPFSVHIDHLKGSVKDISSDKNALIKVALKGLVSNLAPVNINGTISPDQGNSELDLNFNSMPLPIMTPYMAEFAGRKIEKGNMSLDLKYKIQNKKLSASNKLLIDQLVLGDEVENPDAVSIPMGLAIALLQDADGKIVLDVPITGSLDDPEFSVASLVIDALLNVLTKIITSPFYAISSLIEGDEDISKITFSAGEALLDDIQRKKLDDLANALTNRPALKLEIKGTAFTEKDWPQLQLEALEQQLLQMRANEISKDSEKQVLAENLTHSDEENQRYLADLFIQKFPDLAERSLLGTPQLLDPSMGDFYKVAQTRLAAEIPPNNQRLHELAVARAQVIAKHLMTSKITIDRVFLLDVDIDPQTENNIIATELNLIVN